MLSRRTRKCLNQFLLTSVLPALVVSLLLAVVISAATATLFHFYLDVTFAEHTIYVALVSFLSSLSVLTVLFYLGNSRQTVDTSDSWVSCANCMGESPKNVTWK